jgi:hypothetical protein
MRSHIVFKIFLIILLILLAAPLLGELTVMAKGDTMVEPTPGMMVGGHQPIHQPQNSCVI